LNALLIHAFGHYTPGDRGYELYMDALHQLVVRQVRRGAVDLIIISGGNTRPDTSLTEAITLYVPIQDWLRSAGLLDDKVRFGIGEWGLSTEGNAADFAAQLKSYQEDTGLQISSVQLVTDRARLLPAHLIFAWVSKKARLHVSVKVYGLPRKEGWVEPGFITWVVRLIHNWVLSGFARLVIYTIRPSWIKRRIDPEVWKLIQ
jgi:hypothetical protein